MNSTESLNKSVKDVETVEKSPSQRVVQENFSSQPSTKFNGSGVESVEVRDLAAYFSTLSTKLNSSFMEKPMQEKPLIISDLDRFPQIPHFPQEQKDQLVEIFKWLQIVFA